MKKHVERIACSLAPEEMRDRLDDWRALLAHVVDRASIEGGVRVTFGPGASAATVATLAEAEQGCCSFFAFALTFDARGLGLEVTAPPEAIALVAELVGSPG